MGPSNFFIAFLMLLLTASGGPPGSANRRLDLLDLIPTASYWRTKNITPTREQLEADIGVVKPAGDIPKLVKDLESLSRRDAAKKQLADIGAPALDALRGESNAEDPEAAAMAKELVATISQHGKDKDVRRLMAIRTLGERKEKDSLPLLKSLADSKELFVAEYAARAISQIDGTPLPPLPPVELDKDLKMLPSTTGIIGQTTGLGLPGFNLEALITQGLTMTPPGGAPPNPADKDKTIDNLTSQLLAIAETVGNVRADGATVAVSADIGGSNEWFIISVRGTFDREAVAAYAATQNRNAPISHDGDMLKLDLYREAALLLPSDHQLIIASANPANTTLASIIDPLADSLRTGTPNNLADNKPLADLIKLTDKRGPLWVACLPSAKMKSMLPVFAAFDSLSLSAIPDKDQLKLAVTARGTGDVSAAIDQFNSVRELVLPKLKSLIDMSKDFQPLIDAVESAKITPDEKGATATATVSMDIVKSITAAILAEFRFIQMAPAPAPAPAPAAAMPVIRHLP